MHTGRHNSIQLSRSSFVIHCSSYLFVRFEHSKQFAKLTLWYGRKMLMRKRFYEERRISRHGTRVNAVRQQQQIGHLMVLIWAYQEYLKHKLTSGLRPELSHTIPCPCMDKYARGESKCLVSWWPLDVFQWLQHEYAQMGSKSIISIVGHVKLLIAAF